VPVDAENVERDECDSDRAIAVEDALADERPVWWALVVESDEFAVENEPSGESFELGHVRGHVPAAAAADA
jgi:hypothetical protein